MTEENEENSEFETPPPKLSLDIESAMDVDTKNLPVIATDEHIVGLFEGDGNFNVVFQTGKVAEGIANGYRARPRFILSQSEKTGYLEKTEQYLDEKHGIKSKIQYFNDETTDRAPNLVISGQENCKKFLNILLQGNLIGAKLFQAHQVKALFEEIFDKKDPKELEFFEKRKSQKLQELEQKENIKVQRQKEKIKALEEQIKQKDTPSSKKQLEIAKVKLTELQKTKQNKMQDLEQKLEEKREFVLGLSSTNEGIKQLIDFRNYKITFSTNAFTAEKLEEMCGFEKGSSKGKFREIQKKVTKEVKAIREIQRQEKQKRFVNVKPEQIAGLTAAEGSFSISIQTPLKKNQTKSQAPHIVLAVSYKVNSTERPLLQTIAAALNIKNPNISPVKNKKALVMKITRVNDIENKVLPFFTKASFDYHEMKHNQFILFLNVFKAVREGRHLTKDGFVEIVNMVFDTPYRNNHKTRKYTREEYLQWADENWAAGKEPIYSKPKISKKLAKTAEQEIENEIFN